MISEISIENFKSVQELKLELGRITVLIGANGSGKSNILEAIAACSAAAGNKLDHEFLVSRGIRVPDDPHFMRSAFKAQHSEEDITIVVASSPDEAASSDDKEPRVFHCVLQNQADKPYSSWTNVSPTLPGITADKISRFDSMIDIMQEMQVKIEKIPQLYEQMGNQMQPIIDDLDKLKSSHNELTQMVSVPSGFEDFLIYSPENTSLRTFETEEQIQPLGIKGEGLFKLLTVLSREQDQERLKEIKNQLTLLDWFEDFEVKSGLSTGERTLSIKDKYLDENLSYFTQKSVNEGFLFLLFYFTLFISRETPSFFAIDNIDASLNPKLCRQLLKELSELAKTHNKQAIVTTHNPAVLDGLDLDDDGQRLYVVSRNKAGHTKVKRVMKQAALPDQKPVRLSEAFLRGYLGGLPGNF